MCDNEVVLCWEVTQGFSCNLTLGPQCKGEETSIRPQTEGAARQRDRGQADAMESDHDKGLSLSDVGSPGGFVCTVICMCLYVLLIFVLCL